MRIAMIRCIGFRVAWGILFGSLFGFGRLVSSQESFAQTLTSYVQMVAKHSVPNIFLEIVAQVVKGRDIVMLNRFYSEEELSYATVQMTVTGTSSSIHSLSMLSTKANASSFTFKASHVPYIAWKRAPIEYLVYTKRYKFPSNFGELAVNSRAVIRSSNGTKRAKINALRYHLRMKACQFVSTLGGNPSILPVPVVFTTPLNEHYGIYSSDVPGKTCNPENYDFQNNVCRGSNDLVAEMAACDKDVTLYKRFLDKNKNLALILTCQHHFFSHSKLLSLPLGVRQNVEEPIQRFLSFYAKSNSGLIKSKLAIVSTEGHWYQNKVADVLRPLNFTSFSPNELSSVNEYLSLVAKSKFVICPPGFGYDTHCIWESLLVGSIPVVELSPFGPGLERSFSHLPVLVVDDLLKVTISLLETAYKCFVNHANSWHYDQLRQSHWDEIILSTLRNGHRKAVTNSHSNHNLYCNYLQNNYEE